MKTVKLSVREFAVPSPLTGGIDAGSGLGRAQELGLEIHRRVQKRRAEENPDYRAEVWIQRRLEAGGFAFEIGGRMDGLFAEGPRIEEIKTAFSAYELSRRLRSQPEHPYLLQLRTYGYFHLLETGRSPKLSLHLVGARDGRGLDVPVALDAAGYEEWLARRLAELAAEASAAERRSLRRRKTAAALEFPFERARTGQAELVAAVEEGLREKRPMMLQAPTGLGKTVGVLYPALREALGRGQRVVYVTPKNSQHSVAEDAVERLRARLPAGTKLRSMTITAKSKLCLKEEPLCNPDYCEFARGHYTKVAAGGLVEKLSRKKSLTARVFRNMGREHEVCPFELQVDAAKDADAVICDYNFVFAPRSAFGGLSSVGLDQDGKPSLVVDEAHNLPARALDYYSPSLSSAALEAFRADFARLPPRWRRAGEKLLKGCLAAVASCGDGEAGGPRRIEAPAAAFLKQDARLRAFLNAYLASDVEILRRDPVLRLSFYWSEFTAALELASSGRPEFFTTFHPSPPAVKITCCDASEMLKGRWDDYGQVVGFSATLKPFEFYRRLSGLPEDAVKTAEFLSPFPRERRKLLLIPQLSSKYSERARDYPRVAEAASRIAALKRGNYFMFFPSFEFLERVRERFVPPAGFEVLSQERGMSRDAVEETLRRLSSGGPPCVLFAVQGGVFSEGVDYPGEMAIGAFVVGPPLPAFELEREGMREYYQRRYGAGFQYAYAYPAMAKAVQAAGRVIRSETDRGLIVLIDGRFAEPAYSGSMPKDWFVDDPRELVSTSILADVARFWESQPP